MDRFFTDLGEEYVNVCGLQVFRELFFLLEPSYNALKSGVTRIHYDGNQHFREIHAGGHVVRITGRWPDGEHYIGRLDLYRNAITNLAEPDTDIGRRVSEIRSAKEGEKADYRVLRKASYPRTDDLIVALWKLVVEGDDDSMKKLQKIREDIKLRYPAPKAPEPLPPPVAAKPTKKAVTKRKTKRD